MIFCRPKNYQKFDDLLDKDSWKNDIILEYFGR